MPVLDADRFLKLGIHENSDADIASVVTFSRPGDEIVYVMKFTGLRLW
jgi:hypothetical protein